MVRVRPASNMLITAEISEALMPIANEAVPFFFRNGLRAGDIEVCLDLVRDKFGPCRSITPIDIQGGCSYTVTVVQDGCQVEYVVQFRPVEHAISPQIARDAKRVFGDMVPEHLWFEEVKIRDAIRLQVCAMSRVRGVRFCDVQPRRDRLDGERFYRLRELMVGMADFFAKAWIGARQKNKLVEMGGRIGASISERLLLLGDGLPTVSLRSRARTCRTRLDSGLLENLPIVLNHGDLLPSNIMVDDKSGSLTGLVDWAEAEYLYFGMTLYGIEHLLGYLDEERRFRYYRQAGELRNVFWRRLRIKVPELAEPSNWEAVMLSREIGILLWHGIAWDEGKLDRVIDCRDEDVEEHAYLEAFLKDSSRSVDSKL